MSREVMKLALEALYENTQYSMRGDPIAYQDQRNDDIIKTIKAALAQPYPEYDRGFSNGWDKCAERQAVQPEPPAKRPVTNRCPKCVGLSCLCDGSCIKQEPVQEHPEQMARLGWQYVECPACGSEGARAFPKPEQEPVAWLRADGMKAMEADEKKSWIDSGNPELVAEYIIPLFTAPPQRQPLTDAEIWQMVNDCSFNRDLHADKFARAIEAKLKEKNK